MGLEWLGKYKDFIAGLMRFGNAYARSSRTEHSYNTPVRFTPSEIHVLEYILEHEDHFDNMADVAQILGITKGALSKNVKKMEQKGLLEKYHTVGNQKNIILRVSEYGREVYRQYISFSYDVAFRKLFEQLDEIPDEYLQKFTSILQLAADLTVEKKEPEEEKILVPISPKSREVR